MVSKGLTKVTAIGVVPIAPIFFYDIDNYDARDEILKYAYSYHTKRGLLLPIPRHFQVFETKHGYHLVTTAVTWLEVKEKLKEAQDKFGCKYTLNPREQRLRVSPKFDKNGLILSPEPYLLDTCCQMLINRIHQVGDLRFNGQTKKQIYFTFEKRDNND